MVNESSDWQIPGSWVEIYERVFVPAMMGWAAHVIALVQPQPGIMSGCGLRYGGIDQEGGSLR